MEIDDVKVSTEGKLLRDGTGKTVRREVEDGEVDEVLKFGRDWTRESVGREVKGLKIGAVGEIR